MKRVQVRLEKWIYPSNCLLLSWRHIDGMRHVLLRLIKIISNTRKRVTFRNKKLL